MIRTYLVNLMKQYHEYFHLSFGLIAYLVTLSIFPGADMTTTLFLAVIASFLPDFDHLLAVYFYARSTAYSTAIRSHLNRYDLPGAIEHIRRHHKSNHFILSHNLLTPTVFSFLFIFFVKRDSPEVSVFCLSFALHFVFDVIEDLLTLGRLNPNWYLDFKREN